MKVTGDWLTRRSSQTVCAMLTDAGFQALFVGGCVRNALLDAPVSDIDIATDAKPKKVMALAKSAGLKAVPTGIEHGTVTVIDQGIAHEITTFRKDVETDGRRAVVAFSTDVADDAKRRDFTMNAIYARPDGTLVDPLGGLADLKVRRFRFIDDPALRIQEDYLRILRYFRFYAWYGDQSVGLDAEALAAIAAYSAGLETLSKERVGAETLKLLSAPDPAPAVAAMKHNGVLPRILTGTDDRALAPLVHLENLASQPSDAIRRLAALGGQDVSNALRLSKKAAASLALLREELQSTRSATELGYRFGAKTAWSVMLLRHAVFEQPLVMDLGTAIDRGASAVFPVSASDLLDRFEGRALGRALRQLETAWIDSDFALSRAALLKRL